MKHLERWLLFAFIFAIPFQVRYTFITWTTPFNEWTSAFLWGTDILFLLLLSVRIYSGDRPLWRIEDWPLALFLLFAGISLFSAQLPAVGWYRFAKLIEYAALFWYGRQVFRDPEIRTSVIKVVVASALFQAVLGIGQYALQSDLGLRILGESVLDVGGRGVAVVVAHAQLYLRAYGTTPHPNVLAVWLMLGIWALWVWYVRSPSRWLLAVNAVLVVGLCFTFSRTAIAVWLLCSCILLARSRVRPKQLIVTTLLAGALFAAVWWPQVHARLQLYAGDEAVAQRVFYNRLASETVQNSPWLGIGIGQFVPLLMDRLPIYPDVIYQPAHNMALLIVAEIGIVGMLMFAAFLFMNIRRWWHTERGYIVILVSFLLLSCFDHYFWTLQQGALMFWGLLAFAFHGTLKTNDQPRHQVSDSV